MIVRKSSDGTLLLINQTDHSLLSGRLAAHWGNARFAKPRPFESVIRAAAFHDCGWYRYQTGPMLNEQTGETPTFLQVPLDEVQLGAFQWGTDWLTSIDPYAGLLINKHRTGLWRKRYGAMRSWGASAEEKRRDRSCQIVARRSLVRPRAGGPALLTRCGRAAAPCRCAPT